MAKNIVKATGLLLLINLCVKILGFIREMVIANGFGVSAFTDAYFTAYTIPYILQSVLGYAFVSAVLPLLTKYWQQDNGVVEASRLGSTLINIMAGGMVFLCVLGVAGAPLLVWLTAPSLEPGTAALAAELTRIIFPSVLFMSTGMVISGILNSCYRFSAAALAPGLASLSIVVAGLFANGNIHVVAWGTLIGFVLFFLLAAADLSRTQFKYSFNWDLRHPEIRRVIWDILPIVLGLAVNQIYTLVNRIFASGLTEGSISALNYANKLLNMPLGVFVSAIVVVAFPMLAEKATLADKEPLHQSIRSGLSMVLLVALPSALGLMLLDKPIIQLLFQSGEFDAAATMVTSKALFTMGPGLIFLGISMILIRVFYALGDVKTPLLLGAISIAVNVLASLIFAKMMGAAGLGLANTLAAAANALLMWVVLGKRLRFGREAAFRRDMFVIAVSSLVMCVPILFLERIIPLEQGKGLMVLFILAIIGIGVIVYYLSLRLLKAQALREILSGIRRK